ncbi:MAG: hypothetical protein MJ080_03850 [Clostridia bacterium]|nr:hypothetical protein [Clostridia bacterium]
MKTFFKIIGFIVSVFAACVGALAVFDKFFGKSYHKCEFPDESDGE